MGARTRKWRSCNKWMLQQETYQIPLRGDTICACTTPELCRVICHHDALCLSLRDLSSRRSLSISAHRCPPSTAIGASLPKCTPQRGFGAEGSSGGGISACYILQPQPPVYI